MSTPLEAFERLSDRFRALPVGSRLMALALFCFICFGLLWLVRFGAAPQSEVLFGGRTLSEAEVDSIELAFSQAGLTAWVREGRRIRVPLSNRNEYLSVLRDADSLPLALRSHLGEAMDKASLFESSEQRSSREAHAKAQDLGRKIIAFPDIRWASVEYDRGERPGLSRSRAQSASVLVSPEGTEPLGKARIGMIKELVRASYADLSGDDVVVIDTNALQAESDWQEGDPLLRKRLEEEQAYEQKIQRALVGYGDLRVAAHVELELSRGWEGSDEENADAGSMRTSPSDRTEVAGAGGGDRSQESSTAFSASRPVLLDRSAGTTGFRRSAPGTRGQDNGGEHSARRDLRVDPSAAVAAQVRRVRVTVGLPSSYYDKTLRQQYLRQHPRGSEVDLPVPTEEVRQRLREETESRIRAAVTPLLPLAANSEDAVSLVHVWDYPDLPDSDSAVGDVPEGWTGRLMESGVYLLGLVVALGIVVATRWYWPNDPLSSVASPRDSADSQRSIRRNASEEHWSGSEGVAPHTTERGTSTRVADDSARAESYPLAFLAEVEFSTLVSRLREEHPQTVAIILASIPPGLAADLVPELGDELKSEAMRRLSKLALPPPEVMQDIAAQLRSRLCSTPQRSDDALTSLFEAESLEASRSTPLGMAAMSAILEEMSQAEPRATGVGKGFSGKRFQSARSVAEPAAVGPQDRLIGAEPWRLREALAMVDGRQAVLAVCGLPPSVAEALLGSLPRKQARQVRKQIANLGRLELREIDQAQALVARHLDAFDRQHGEAEHEAGEGLVRARQLPTKLAEAA